ncbi:MAG: DUF4424 domain-containing protein [Parasphingorhabdus sp.]
MFRKSRLSVWIAFAILFSGPALANDSEAELSLGGLVLKQSDNVSMDSEDLYISQDQVRIRYTFTNHSDRDVKTIVAFPMPPQPNFNDDFFEGNFVPDWENLKFQTWVDGKPIKLTINERIAIDGKDISKRLTELNLPHRWFENYEWLEAFQKKPEAELMALAKEGLISKNVSGWEWLPRWQLVTEISREQIFPAGKTITVEHSYAPQTGGSVGGGLLKGNRSSYPEAMDYYKERWCVDDFFLRGFDRRNDQKNRDGRESYHGEIWVGYILSSGANWKGPIKDFRLVVDKGSTDNLVSFCMDGVKKIGPTQFEVRKTNFEPKRDLNILIVKWYDLNQD